MFDDLLNKIGWVMGLLLAFSVSFVASNFAEWLGEDLLGFARSPISGIMMAIIIGMIVANTFKMNPYIKGGLKFCASTILRIGIMLLGIRLSLLGAGKFTLVALPFVLTAISIGLLAVRILGRKMNLSPQLTGLIAVGTSICGATAIVATAPLIKAKEAEVGYSIACITVFGLAAMFFYPILGHFLFAEKPALAGLFLGTSIHETAQVAGAGLMYQTQYNAPLALDYATVTKLVRNLCMIAVIPVVGLLYSGKSSTLSHASQSWLSMIPWFIIGFALMSAIRTIGDLGEKPFFILSADQWNNCVQLIKFLAEELLLIAMSAVGLTTLFAGMKKIGFRPFLLGLFAALLIGVISLLSILFFAEVVIDFIG
ncbi:MAG TPA: putative sulfate exporter family transporter [Woeseiaceae bacterium]|nr:putative sulfate exporter family transporter [Woeseiaceae bacterium]